MEACLDESLSARPQALAEAECLRKEREAAFLDRLMQVFERLRTAGIQFCVLRNRDRIPGGLLSGSDVDVVLPADTNVHALLSLLTDLHPVHVVPHYANLEVYLPVGELF